MTATRDELEHEVARLRSENEDLRDALTKEAEELGRDDKEAEQAASRFWYASWKNAMDINRRLREEIARMKEARRG